MNLDDLTPDELAELQAKIAERQRSAKRSYSEKSIQYLEEQEIEALLDAASASKNPRDVAILEIAWHHGLRASEIGLLKIEDVHLGQRSRSSGKSFDRIFIRRLKHGESKEYVMTLRTSKAVRRWITIRGRRPGALFESRNGRPISRRRLDEIMKHYGARAGLPPEKRHFHCLRHTAATTLCEFADLVEVQDALGHRDIRSTMKYAKVRSKRRLELGERLADKW